MLRFNAPIVQIAKEMQALNLHGDGLTNDHKNQDYPPKTPRNVLDLILVNKTSKISLVEWHRFFSDRIIWLEIEGSDYLEDVVLEIFSEAESQKNLRYLLLLKSVFTVETGRYFLPVSLFSQLPLLADGLQGVDSDRFRLLCWINQEDYSEIADMLFSHITLPFELLEQYGWPTYTNMRKKIEDAFASNLASFDWLGSQEYLLHSLNTVGRNICADLVNNVLNVISTHNLDNKLEEWFELHCAPEAVNSLWGDLSDLSKSTLIKRFNFSVYSIHKKMVLDYFRTNEKSLPLEKQEKLLKRTKSRLVFWSNYSKQILRSRLLVPKNEFYSVEKKEIDLGVLDVTPLDNENPTEILVLEFKSIIVVDQLRPSGAAVRIYKKEFSSSDFLLNQNPRFEKDILVLHQDDIHDHGLYWQGPLERLLRGTYNCLPNADTKSFKGLPPSANSYSFKKGLPNLSREQSKARSESLLGWTSKFLHGESMLGKYDGGQRIKRQLELNRLRMLYHAGRIGEYTDSLRLEAQANNIWAMQELARFLLTRAAPTPEERREGEKWHMKFNELNR